MNTSPAWLYYAFGVAMLLVAAYGVVLLALGVVTQRAAGWDVDVAHVLMGLVMTGMFVNAWSFGPSALWELVFAGLATWFLARGVHSMLRFGLHVPHESIHAVMSFAMVLMLLFVAAPVAGSSMSMGIASTTRIEPAVTLALAFLLLGSAVFTLASPVKGLSHGASRLAVAMVGDSTPIDAESSSGGLDTARVVASPMLEDVSHVIMCIAMAFMLLLMN